MGTEPIRLRVSEAFQQDIGLGIGRLDQKTRDQLKVGLGDIVAIQGRTTTPAIVSRAGSEDEGKGIVRIEAVVRRNAGVSIGDQVLVLRIECPVAESLTIAPIYSGAARVDLGSGLETFVAKALARRPFVKGDVFVIPGVFLQGGSLPFIVTSTLPKGIIQVGPSTTITIRQEAVTEADVSQQVRKVSYEDIGGAKEVIKQVREIVEVPLSHPEVFKHLGTEPPGGILLYGPPGTGKTLIARALAGETGATFIAIPGPELASGKITEEELNQKFQRARDEAPSVIFLDEVDTIAPRRDIPAVGEHERRIVAQLLTLLDGVSGRGNVVVLGATNRIDTIDPALRRPGRFDREILVPLPSLSDREEVLTIKLRGVRYEGNETEIQDLIHFIALYTEGFSSADLTAVAQEASVRAVNRFRAEHPAELAKGTLDVTILEGLKVRRTDFIEALLGFVPSSRRGPRLQ